MKRKLSLSNWLDENLYSWLYVDFWFLISIGITVVSVIFWISLMTHFFSNVVLGVFFGVPLTLVELYVINQCFIIVTGLYNIIKKIINKLHNFV